jgi:hypothetical protein
VVAIRKKEHSDRKDLKECLKSLNTYPLLGHLFVGVLKKVHERHSVSKVYLINKIFLDQFSYFALLFVTL